MAKRKRIVRGLVAFPLLQKFGALDELRVCYAIVHRGWFALRMNREKNQPIWDIGMDFKKRAILMSGEKPEYPRNV